MYYCANYTDLYVGGEWQGSENLGVMTYYVKRCDANTEKEFKIKCATDEELIKELGSFIYISTYTQQTVINPKNFTNPITNILVYNYDALNINGQGYQRLFYSYSSIKTDTGVIFEESSSEQMLEYDRTIFGISTLYPENGYIYEVSIQVSRHLNQYSRSYIKLQGIAAIIGGFMKLGIEVVSIIFSLYSDNAYRLFLYKKLLKLEIEENNELPSFDNKIEMSKIKQQHCCINFMEEIKYDSPVYTKKRISKIASRDINLGLNDSILPLNKTNAINFDVNSPNNELIQLIKCKEKRKLKVKLTFCDQFKYAVCCSIMNISNENHQRSRKELLILADMEISKKFNIISILKKNDQFDLLTKTLLNKNQSFMLKNRDLRNIIVNEQNVEYNHSKKMNNKNTDLNKKTIKKSIENLEAYLISKYKNKTFNISDQLLLSFLDDPIKDELEIKSLL